MALPNPIRHRMRLLVPPWLSDRADGRNHGWRFLFTIAALIDVMIEAALQALLARFPGTGTPTALARIGRDRGIIRGRSESDAAYSIRLVRWLYDWRSAGNAYTLMRQIRGYLHPYTPLMRVVNTAGTWYTMNPDGTVERSVAVGGNWDWDGDVAAWARFWVIIYSHTGEPWVRGGTWGSGRIWGSGPGTGLGTWGSMATIEQITSIRAIIKEWKSAGAKCQNIIISFVGTAFDPTDTAPPLPDGTWGNYSKDNGAGVWIRARSADGLYCEGTG